MLERFLHYLKYEKRYSPHTIKNYKTDLLQFEDFLKAHYNINDFIHADSSMIRTWFVIMIDQKISPRSINRKKAALNSFYRFLKKQKLIAENPMLKVLSPKTTKRLPTFIDEKKMLTLLDDSFSDNPDDFITTRNLLIIEMFYVTGMRLSELVNLKESDINFYNLTIKVLGKRNKERIIPISKRFADLLKHYIEIKNKNFSDNIDNEYLFITARGKQIYQKLVYRIVNKYLSLITTQKKKSPHVLRHTFATHMLNHGADLNAIKEILGHANLSATQVYTHNTIEKLKTIYKQAHPKA